MLSECCVDPALVRVDHADVSGLRALASAAVQHREGVLPGHDSAAQQETEELLRDRADAGQVDQRLSPQTRKTLELGDAIAKPLALSALGHRASHHAARIAAATRRAATALPAR